MPDETRDEKRFEFHENRKWLFVSLERPVVEQVFNLVQAQSGIAELAEIQSDQVSEILIYDGSRRISNSGQPSWWKRWLGFFGCGIAAFAILFVFMMGILAICGIVRLPRGFQNTG